MLNMKGERSDKDHTINLKRASTKLFVGLAFVLIAPNLMAGMFDIDLLQGCRYNYTYDTVKEDQLASFFGFHFEPHDPNPVCVKYIETVHTTAAQFAGQYYNVIDGEPDHTNPQECGHIFGCPVTITSTLTCTDESGATQTCREATPTLKGEKLAFNTDDDDIFQTYDWCLTGRVGLHTDCPQPANPIDKIINEIVWMIRAFALIMGVVIFVGAGLPIIKYQFK